MSQFSPQPKFGMAPPQPVKKSGGSTIWIIIAIVMAVVVLMSICVIVALAALLIPAVGKAREAAQRVASANNLRQIGLGIHMYHDFNQSFPNGYVGGANNSKPMHSWRTQILPYVEEENLFRQVDQQKPWNDPVNSLLSMPISFYKSQADKANDGQFTNYVAIVDKEAVFFPGKAVHLRDVTDGTSNTIIVIEVVGSQIPWAEPRDMSIDQAINTIKNSPTPTVNVLTADGAVHPISRELPVDQLRAMMTRQGGETVFF